MPFTLQSSGNKDFVKSQVTGQIEGSYNMAPAGPDRDENKASLEKIRDYLFDSLGADYPPESPTGLVLFGDAGKDYISITRMEFSLSKPPKAADTTNNPAPDKQTVREMIPPAPDKKPVGEGNASAQELAKSVSTPPDQKQPTTASPNFENTGTTTPPNTSSGGKF